MHACAYIKPSCMLKHSCLLLVFFVLLFFFQSIEGRFQKKAATKQMTLPGLTDEINNAIVAAHLNVLIWICTAGDTDTSDRVS